ncbi:MAG: hypothetical protein M1834_001707 [Cirrosporium novae-zelandiae]|nr:MAG: hypothetical protein M1834_001707 [Cirrosporium novae-zelandiae]
MSTNQAQIPNKVQTEDTAESWAAALENSNSDDARDHPWTKHVKSPAEVEKENHQEETIHMDNKGGGGGTVAG